MTSSAGLSNAASVVGKHIAFLDDGKEGVLIGYDPNTNTHTVQFSNGKEKAVILNKHRFKFLVQKCESADTSGYKLRKLRAAQKDAVGRKLEIFSRKRNKYLQGTIEEFDEETGKHSIKIVGCDKIQNVDLQRKELKWRYTDLIGNRRPSTTSIVTSKYAGVRRSCESSWIAYKDSITKENYIGTFRREEDAALAHDFYARQLNRGDINFPDKHISKAEIEKRRSRHNDYREGAPARGHGKSKYRGVHWQKNRKRWMARYSLAHKGEKNINLGAFDTAEHAAMAFDAEARKRGRPDCDLNFPDEHPTKEQLDDWSMNTAHYTMMRSGREKSSQYRGVTFNKQIQAWRAQCNIKQVVEGFGKKKGPVHIGYPCENEQQAALEYDRCCRKFGVAEKELNFPRDNQLLKEVRLFDDECYFCLKANPTDPVATPCNHVFCRACIVSSLESSKLCPCCQMPDLNEDLLRPVKLIPWPKAAKTTRKRKRQDTEGEIGRTKSQRNAEDLTDTAANESNGDDKETVANAKAPASEESSDEVKPKYQIGTQFIKYFEGHGKFRGRVTGFDGRHYSVHYPEDDDNEELSEDELDELQVLFGSGSASDTDDDSDNESVASIPPPKYPMGTVFVKMFPGFGKYEGKVVDYDGERYKVVYPKDGDDEVLNESDLDELEILDFGKH